MIYGFIVFNNVLWMCQARQGLESAIQSLRQEYQKVIRDMSSQPSGFSGQQLLNLDYPLSKLIDRTAQALSCSELNSDTQNSFSRFAIPEVISAVERISRDMRLASKQFDQTMTFLERQFHTNIDDANRTFLIEKQHMVEEHAKRKHDIADVETRFSRSLADKVSSIQAEIADLQVSIRGIEDSSNGLHSTVNELSVKNSALEEELSADSLLIESQHRDLQSEFDAALIELQSRTDQTVLSLQNENASLKQTLDQLHITNTALIDELRGKLVEKTTCPSFDSQLSEYESELRAVEESLKAKLRQQETRRASETGPLRSEISSNRHSVNTCDASLAARMKSATAEASASLLAKDAELNGLRSDFMRQIEATRNIHRLEIEKTQEIRKSEIAQLESEISDTLRVAEEHRKKLECDIAQMRLPIDHKPREPDQMPMPTARRYRPAPPPQRDPMKAIREHFSAVQCQSGQKWAEFERLKTETEIEQKALNATLKNSVSELESLKTEISNNSGQIYVEEVSPKEKDFTDEIRMQKAVISQLRDESERLRVDVSKRKTLQAIQIQRIQAVGAIEASMDLCESNCRSRLAAVTAEMSAKLAEEQKRNAALIQRESQKLEAALEQLKEVQRLGEDDGVGSFAKWNELRGSIGESTLSICDRYFSEARSTSPNPRLAAFREPSLLPSLHHS
jgi:hypothetical protein